jgi:hypothetical protein
MHFILIKIAIMSITGNNTINPVWYFSERKKIYRGKVMFQQKNRISQNQHREIRYSKYL